MTATLTTASTTASAASDSLRARLDLLYADRAEALAEITPEGSGDAADRATNVDGHIRLAMLEERIATLEVQLSSPAAPLVHSDTVVVGSTVSVDFGDGPEPYLIGTVDEAIGGIDVITPGSPLGRALLGASAGDAVSYAPAPGRRLTATVVSVG